MIQSIILFGIGVLLSFRPNALLRMRYWFIKKFKPTKEAMIVVRILGIIFIIGATVLLLQTISNTYQ